MISEAFSHGWDLFKEDIWKYIGLYLVGAAVSYLLGSGWVDWIWSIIFTAITSYGIFTVALKRDQGIEPTWRDFIAFFSRIDRVIALNLMAIGAAILFGLSAWFLMRAVLFLAFLIVIPAVYFGLGVLLVIPSMLDRDLGAWESVLYSLDQMKGYRVEIFFFTLIFSLVGIVISLIPLVGWLITSLVFPSWLTCCYTFYYGRICGYEGKLP